MSGGNPIASRSSRPVAARDRDPEAGAIIKWANKHTTLEPEIGFVVRDNEGEKIYIRFIKLEND